MKSNMENDWVHKYVCSHLFQISSTASQFHFKQFADVNTIHVLEMDLCAYTSAVSKGHTVCSLSSV